MSCIIRDAGETVMVQGPIILEDTTVRIVNKTSHRCLYAQRHEDWDAGFGASSLNSGFYEDSKWHLRKAGDGHHIVNEHSERKLYAQANKCQNDGIGASSPIVPDYDDAVWYIVPDGDSFRIENKHSQRRLYAQEGEDWNMGIGAYSDEGDGNEDDALWELRYWKD